MASMSGCTSNCTRSSFFEHSWTSDEMWAPWEVLSEYFEYQPWFFSLLGSAMVGLSGVFPLLVIPIDEAADLKNGDSAKTLKILLSFAVGGLLGDVFLHLLPEAWANHAASATAKTSGLNHGSMGCGLWVLCGFLVFVIAEKMFSNESDENEDDTSDDEAAATLIEANKTIKEKQQRENNNSKKLGEECAKTRKNGINSDAGDEAATKLNGQLQNGLNKVTDAKNRNGYTNGFAKVYGVKKNGFCTDGEDSSAHEKPVYEKKVDEERTKEKPKRISGYLNLMANCVDNFTHGLAVGGSFLVSFRLGALTTFAILIHEIPHEIGDFAILLRSGFNRWDAAKAQLMTATGGICGAFVAVLFSGDAVESKTSWILPFTAGGFLHIGMVTVLPELLKETNPLESLKQIGALLTGIVVMAFLTIMCD